jgi:ATP-dependent exoDNAse (exonuclease V) beta subunit
VNLPSDHSERRRFAEGIERNFSVVAAAGSGKTYAITERIVQIALSPKAQEILPRLVVVTFTHRAADEMQQRTRHRILREVRRPEVHVAFNRAFFGTIHSFCMKLLANYGHYLGLPTTLDLVTDDEDLWEEFVQQYLHVGTNLSDENRAALFRLAQARQLMELGRNARSVLAPSGKIGPCPKIDFSQVHKASASARARENIAASKAELVDWETRYGNDWEFVRWPVRFGTAKDFAQLWSDTFAPLRKWVTDCAMCVAAEVQRDYRDFRLTRGVITYPDQVALADELMQHPIAGRRVREENFRVILDEAQDTDPAQFSVLTEITRPPKAIGRWLETETDPPRPGHFCMVGDFQQSIYHDRADLENYNAIHELLVRQDDADKLQFSVTFRLDEQQLNFINQTFREILNGQEGQVDFVEMQPRPEVLPGQVIRVSLGKNLLPEDKLKDYRKAKIAAKALAAWIKKTGHENLRADSWSEVAILCPRKAWLRTMAIELRKLGVPVAIQSESDLKGDHPAHAWLTALCTIMSDPFNSYEIVGVLREVFGISDHDLALFSEGEGVRFRIDQPATIAGVVSSPLRLLAETRVEMTGRALFDAVKILVARTHLRERIASLPVEDFPSAENDLDALLALVAAAEAEGATLEEFAAKLRADFLTPRDVRLSSENGLQLITAQKAKGSEWQAVILPFLGRNVIPPSPRYPCLLKIPGKKEVIAALNKDDFQEDNRAIVKRATQQEAARLLYVAATRARHTLVFVDDGEIFLNSKGSLQSNAQLRHFGDNVAAIMANVSTEAKVCAATTQAKERSAKEESPVPLAPFEKRDREKAMQRARKFIRKINPSAYEPDVDLEQLEVVAPRDIYLRGLADNLATLHGRWWHTFFQNIKWRDGLAGADRLFQTLQAQAPDRERSAKEWKRVREALFASETARRFAATDAKTHTEFPFSWSINQNSALEGVIDFLSIEEEQSRALLIDWKTNHVSLGETEVLRVRYRPQLAAYWKAVGAITRLEVSAGLFSTALGRLLLYEPAELAAEWKRLEQLPPDRVAEEISIP